MNKKRIRYLIPKLLLVLVAAIALGIAFAPWKPWLETKLISTLRAQGLNDISFRIGSLGWSGISLDEVNLGKETAVTFDHVTLGYSVSDFRTRNFRDVTVTNITYTPKDTGIRVGIAKTVLNIAQQPDGSWSGDWKVTDVTLKDAPLLIPALAGNGTFAIQGSTIKADGFLADPKDDHRAEFALDYTSGKPSNLKLIRAFVPWNEGVLSVRDTTIPLGGTRDTRLTLYVDDVSMELLMASLTGDKAKGTGSISGNIPVTLHAKGGFTFGSGNLKADTPGIIALSPEVIPGDNPQVGLVRDLLKNLHYSLLTMRLETKPDNKLTVYMSVEGTNPDVAGARPVRLNVQLNGDLLQLVTQSIMTLTSPETLLKQVQ